MPKKAKKKRKPPFVWYAFGLFGLKITNDRDGLKKPIFGDATLVSKEFIINTIKASVKDFRQDVADVLSGAKSVIELKPQEQADIRIDRCNHILPDSFIVVKVIPSKDDKNKDREQARVKAREIASAISFHHSLHTMTTNSFSLNGNQHSWSPEVVSSFNNEGNFEWANIGIDGHRGGMIDPIEVEKENLRSSYNSGKRLAGIGGKQWDISKDRPVMRAFVQRRRNQSLTRIIRAAIHLTDCIFETFPPQQLSKSVTAYEILFVESSNFKLLENRMQALIKSDDKLNQIFTLRHRYVHEGEGFDESTNQAISSASVLTGMVATHCVADLYLNRKFKSIIDLRKYLDWLHLTRKLDDYWDAIEVCALPTELDYNPIENLGIDTSNINNQT